MVDYGKGAELMKRVNWKKWLLCAAICCLMMVLGAAQVFAEELSGSCGTSVTWTLDDDGNLTISGTGAMKTYNSSSTKPDWIKTGNPAVTTVTIEENVTSVGAYAFYHSRNSITSITLSSTVTSIGNYAFKDCSLLEEVELSCADGYLAVGTNAFENCEALNSITWSKLKSIGNYAFQNCGFASVTIPATLTSDVGTSAFKGCKSLTEVVFEGKGTTHK